MSHQWRPVGGFLFGGVHLGARQVEEDGYAVWWERHWAAIGRALRGSPTAPPPDARVLLSHAPPRGALDIIRAGGGELKGSNHGERVGDVAMMEMLEATPTPPLLHAFGHVHALQSHDEPPEGGDKRLAASRRVRGCLFANVAAERQLPEITGFRLARQHRGERRL